MEDCSFKGKSFHLILVLWDRQRVNAELPVHLQLIRGLKCNSTYIFYIYIQYIFSQFSLILDKPEIDCCSCSAVLWLTILKRLTQSILYFLNNKYKNALEWTILAFLSHKHIFEMILKHHYPKYQKWTELWDSWRYPADYQLLFEKKEKKLVQVLQSFNKENFLCAP